MKRLTLVRLDWHDGALCAQADPELFFPEAGGPHRDAVLICARCPAQAACLEYALATAQEFGIWAGTTPEIRRDLSGRRRRRARREVAA